MPRAATTVATAVETDVSCGVNSFLSAAGGAGYQDLRKVLLNRETSQFARDPRGA